MNSKKTNWPILAAMVLVTAMAIAVSVMSKSQCACAQTIPTPITCNK